MYGHAVTDHLLAMSEAAALLGMTKQGFAKLLAANADFPAPTAVLSVGRIWTREDVERWARKHDRTVTAPAKS